MSANDSALENWLARSLERARQERRLHQLRGRQKADLTLLQKSTVHLALVEVRFVTTPRRLVSAAAEGP